MPVRGVRVIEQRAAMHALLSSPQGAVARDLARRAINVQNRARLNATGAAPLDGATNAEQRGPRVRTGRLRSSIAWEIVPVGGSIAARIGTNVEYGLYLETGLRNGVTYPFLRPALIAARY